MKVTIVKIMRSYMRGTMKVLLGQRAILDHKARKVILVLRGLRVILVLRGLRVILVLRVRKENLDLRVRKENLDQLATCPRQQMPVAEDRLITTCNQTWC
jgi:hypothetical protein